VGSFVPIELTNERYKSVAGSTGKEEETGGSLVLPVKKNETKNEERRLD